METIKTAVVVVLLLAVLYGVYVMLNKPEVPVPQEAWNAQATGLPEIDTGKPAATAAAPGDSFAPPAGRSNAAPEAPGARGPRPGRGPIMTLGGEEESDKPNPNAASGAKAQLLPPGILAHEPEAAGLQPTPATSPPRALPQDGEPAASSPVPLPTAPGEPTLATDEARPPRSLGFNDGKDPEFRSVRAFDNAWNSALSQLGKQQWGEALLTLSLFFNSGELAAEEHQRLVDLLDPLAGKVIYSREHLLQTPYQVRPGETLQDIAQQFQVTPDLLQNINGITNPAAVTPGKQLKVIRGPFRADVDLKKNELVLFAGKYYAGRFAISVGNDPRPSPSEYQVVGKQPGREYRGPDGTRIPGGAPDNPYGRWWIDLGDNVGLHSTPEAPTSRGGLGCIALNDRDAADIYAILAMGSKVSIH